MPQRNAAELRAAAIATGLFDGPRRVYVGDGYSIPWEVAKWSDVPSAFTMLTFKLYLDTNYKEYSRLHDWLYTPYGRIIRCSQTEADDALQEELSRDDPVSAVIVGNACRYFGHIYFGRSQTGYFGEQGTVLGNNITPARPTVFSNPGVTVPTKIVILFQQSTNPTVSSAPLNYAPATRTAGWSESLYGPDSIDIVIQQLKGPRSSGLSGLLPARAGLLSQTATIIGCRLYRGGAGRGQPLNVSYAGGAGVKDLPGVALQLGATSTNFGFTRRWDIRGIEDDAVKEGEYAPTVTMKNAMQKYLNALSGFGWYGKIDAGLVSIFSISGAGLVTALTPHTFAVNDIVTIKLTYSEEQGKRFGGQYKVAAVGPSNKEFTLQAWPNGETLGGTASIPQLAYADFGSSERSVVRATYHKVGRPFAAFVGRKSRQRARV